MLLAACQAATSGRIGQIGSLRLYAAALGELLLLPAARMLYLHAEHSGPQQGHAEKFAWSAQRWEQVLRMPSPATPGRPPSACELLLDGACFVAVQPGQSVALRLQFHAAAHFQ